MDDHHNNSWLTERAHQAMLDNGFEPEFSDAVYSQLRQIADRGEPSHGADIQDLRHLLWSSIDNRTSRDLDQVEWAERLENDDIRVLVGIADVDAIVAKGTPIDVHAAQNTVTVYTESKIFPMLPEELSTDKTSLNQDEDRFAVVADMTVRANGDVPESTFFRAFIRNHAKFSYEEIGEWLDGDGPMPEELQRLPELKAQIELQREAAKRLAAYREKKGALEFESIESSAVVEDGEIKGLVSVRSNSAKKLIENFMVAANVEMAEFLEAKGFASLRRVVKEPQRWDGIRRIASEYGENLPELPDQPSLAAFLNKRRAADSEHFPDLSLSIVKLIGGGEYVVERQGEDSGGHFGLAVRDYAHSTAPNRRFTDIVVQRLVKAVISNQPQPYSNEELDAIAEHCNEQEKSARKVERKMRKVVAATVMQRHIGENFEAIVTGVTASGTFARILRPPVDGRIEQGEHGLQVGEKVKVRLVSADPRTGFIDFAAIG
ncbi:MAG TPA: RNB domain-containing ribonuclease [Pyrinomonadaceae bacterium]|nr:RNB domain-containing ribonuclease [Acidobacteriota bacterium]HQZ97528.1 RNB domain-containing ribonuclease [Pyrinomonadaceae bacterium]